MATRDRIKNRNDARYLKVQVALDKVFGKHIKCGHVASLQVKEVAQEAKVFESTFYDHHHNLDDAMRHMNTKMDRDIKVLVREAEQTKCSLEVTYTKLLFFVAKNKDYYDVIVARKLAAPLCTIMEKTKSLIIKDWTKRSARSLKEEKVEKSFCNLMWEFCGEIWWWGVKYKFAESEISVITKRLINATNDAYAEAWK
ncbi:hypothetical protein IJG78_00165 [Candidatus Saccharibacteria bacterium]|nr:hypothetical protein [Candidatus Saccharibacteria bacterium]